MTKDILAFDRSLRSIDADGRMHIAVSHISKAIVNDYYGREIPGHAELGLNPDTIYKMLRDPAELEKGAATFNNLPLLSKHVPVSADNPEKNLVVGSTGTDAKFNAPYLDNSLVIWDAVAIAGIESEEQCELSCSYRYKPVMTPGIYDGNSYDGIMTQIVGNHVALVEVGRAGPDVVVSDANPFNTEQTTMKQKRIAALTAALVANLPLAQDAQIDHKALALKLALALDAEPDDDKDGKKVAEDDDDKQRDDESDADYKKRMDAKKAAEDDEETEMDKKDEAAAGRESNKKRDEKDDKAAMDAAIATAESSAIKRMQAIAQAERDVRPLIGEIVAMDSAEAVYKLALDQVGVDVKGVHPSAYSALVKMHIASKSNKPALAHDSAASSDFWAQFPNAVLPARS